MNASIVFVCPVKRGQTFPAAPLGGCALFFRPFFTPFGPRVWVDDDGTLVSQKS